MSTSTATMTPGATLSGAPSPRHRIRKLGVASLVGLGLAASLLGVSPAHATDLAPARLSTGTVSLGGTHTSPTIANPVRPTHHECKPNDPAWGCGGPADPDNVTESTDCNETQGQDPTTGNAVFQTFCLTSTTYWEGQDKDF